MDDDNRFTPLMTKEIADFIREQRVEVGRSWRGVGWVVHEKFPELGIVPISDGWVNQLDGVDLCAAAMAFLGESVDQGWN